MYVVNTPDYRHKRKYFIKKFILQFVLLPKLRAFFAFTLTHLRKLFGMSKA